MRSVLVVLGLVFGTALTPGFAPANDREPKNLVASHLFAEWILAPELTAKLGADAKDEKLGTITFQADAAMEKKILETVPAKLAEKLKTFKVYASGTLTLRGQDHPFLLTDLAGSPHVVYFRERQGNPMGDAESFYVSIAVGAPAKDAAPPRDLLFVGGDFDNQPFRAYTRAR